MHPTPVRARYRSSASTNKSRPVHRPRQRCCYVRALHGRKRSAKVWVPVVATVGPPAKEQCRVGDVKWVSYRKTALEVVSVPRPTRNFVRNPGRALSASRYGLEKVSLKL